MGLFGKAKKDKDKAVDDPRTRGMLGLSTPRYGSASQAGGQEATSTSTHQAPTPVTLAGGGMGEMGTMTVDQITTALTECFHTSSPYIRINTSILVACHSAHSLSTDLFSHESSVIYSDACYHDLDFTARDTLAPHIFELTADAYMHLRRLRQDQAIVLSGVSGSGKSETAKLISDQVCVLASNSGRHNTRAQLQVSYVGAVIEAFTSARTRECAGATRAGLWQEIQFNERGHVSGCKVVGFGLDRWRVTDRDAGEGTFNVFYYLLHGSTSSERQEWQFRPGGDDAWFAYLRTTAQSKKQQASLSVPLPPSHCAFMMDQLRTALRVCGVRSQHALFQVLAAIMHLGNTEFADDRASSDETATVKTPEQVSIVAQCLGVPAASLTAALLYKTALVNSDLCTVFLNSHGATAQRNALARALYHLVFYWLLDTLNQQLGDEDAANHIAVLQMYGFSMPASSSCASFEQFAVNLANERLHAFVLSEVLGETSGIAQTMHDDAAPSAMHVTWAPRLQTAHLLAGDREGVGSGGVVGALEAHGDGDAPLDDIALINAVNRAFGQHPSFVPGPPPTAQGKGGGGSKVAVVAQFGIRHYVAPVTYAVAGFCQRNMDLEVSADFYALFRASRSRFVRRLFASPQIALDCHPEDSATVVGAFLSTRPPPATTRTASSAPDASTFVGELSGALDDVFASADRCKLWHVVHIRGHSQEGGKEEMAADAAFIRQQVQAFALAELAQRRAPIEFTVALRFDAFVERYAAIVRLASNEEDAVTAPALVERVAEARSWVRGQHYTTGHRMVFLTERVWRSIDVELRAHEKRRRMVRPPGILDALAHIDDNGELVQPPPHQMFAFDADASTVFGSEVGTADGFSPDDLLYADTSSGSDDDSDYYLDGGGESEAGGGEEEEKREEREREEHDINPAHGNFDGDYGHAAVNNHRRNHNHYRRNQPQGEGLVEEVETTAARRCWTRTTHGLTWLIPDWLMSCCGMKREDMRMAWREKVAICLIILSMWAFVLFFIIGLGLIMCPKQYVYNIDELADHTERSDAYVALRGRVYDITNFLNQEHGKSRGGASPEDMIMYAGQEVNASFPLALRAACPDLIAASADPNWLMYLKSDIETETSFPFVHRAGSLANSKSMMRQDFYYRHVVPKMRHFKVGDLVWDLKYIRNLHHRGGMYWRVINGEVFNLGPYFATRDAPENVDQKKWRFLHRLVESIFEDAGARDTDVTKYWKMLPLSKPVRQANYRCMKSLFYVGKVDSRHSFRCLFPNFLLLAAACLLMVVISIKFLASLQLSSRRKPQKHDKFVICQVPCYTEGESSLRRTIDTLATLGYDDKHRLLFIICDGNIVGSGNDRPTPRIVLDILGVDPKLDPPARSFRSIGEGGQQHNMAKVYSGLYEYEGHVVPYLVVAKIGKPTEKSRPGNRGKRDSQMLLLHFLNRVHFESPMSPLDLEIYHQLKNVIGVHPSLYEYVLMVDADTEVLPDSLTRLVACMVHDAKVIGICGETQLTNEDFSWTTMIQVYEYFISHHMAKAFESLFGSVTCLPGCFCMYRLRTGRGMPLIISKNVIGDYSENHVDTLHKKNLLSLGEDRYLTTLMMKYFPQYKMTFTADAKCKTTAPDTWSVLLSQRRRWINSTVHNLAELMFLPEMCGFCCFSMRFVVFIDLLGTLTMPCTLFYLAYLAYLAISKIADIGYISLILIGAIYGLQAIIFVLKRQWQHIGWMVIYLLAYPLWSFFIPIYAFWHMDDFSWGNTRIVVGEDGKRQIFVKDEEPFDPDEIPMRTWAEYEGEIHKRQQQIQDLEAVAQAIDEFANNGVRPVSRFTHIPGLENPSTTIAAAFQQQQQQQQQQPLYPIAAEYNGGGAAYSSPRFSAYFGSMPAATPPQAAIATPCFNLVQMPPGTHMPSDDALAAAISSILDASDLSTVTMKVVRDELSRMFAVDMSPRREFISQTVQAIIQRRAP